LRNEKLEADLNFKNTELASSAMHLVKKGELLDEEWEYFTKHFDKVHSNFIVSLKAIHPNISNNEIKLCAYLRMNLTTKEIA
jgi:hypothetical protein